MKETGFCRSKKNIELTDHSIGQLKMAQITFVSRKTENDQGHVCYAAETLLPALSYVFFILIFFGVENLQSYHFTLLYFFNPRFRVQHQFICSYIPQ